MAVEIDNIYMDLNRLLADICQFLTDKNNYEKLSVTSRQQADLLLMRSKRQLQQIAKLSPNVEDGGDYVDMDPKQANQNDSNYDNVYANKTKESEPYEDLPAKELSREVKYGNLMWRRRKAWLFDMFTRIYAGIHTNWFILYSDEKDSKPIQTFNLEIYKAEVIPKAKNQFELICISENKKSQVFTAEAWKDMNQWVSFINQVHEEKNNSYRISTDSEESEIYQQIFDPSSKTKIETPSSEEDENIYDSIQITVRPQLPKRLKVEPLPPIPVEVRDSIQSQVSYSTAEILLCDNSEESTQEVPVQNENEKSEGNVSETDSFSDGSSSQEGDYDAFVTVIHPNKPEPIPKFTSPLPKPLPNPKPKILENLTFSTFRQS